MTFWWNSHHSPPHLDFCENQVCSVRGLLLSVASPKVITVCSRCSSHDFKHRMSHVLLDLNLPWLANKNTRRCMLTWKHDLAVIDKKKLCVFVFMIIQGISRQCLVYGHKLDRQSQDGVYSQKLWLTSKVVALRTRAKEYVYIYIYEWKGYMVKKNRRNNFFSFWKER